MNLSLVNITTAAVFQLLALCSQSAFTMGVGLKGTLPNINSNGHNEEQKIHRALPSNKFGHHSLVALVQDIDGPGEGGIHQVFGTASLSFKNLSRKKAPEGPDVFTLKITVSHEVAEELDGLTGGAFLSPISCLEGPLEGLLPTPGDDTAFPFDKWHLIGDTTDGGISQSASPFDFGALSSADMEGQSVYLTSDGDKVIACGMFEKQTDRVGLFTRLGKYPDYEGPDVQGSVTVVFDQDGTFSLRYRMGGLESDCQGCGIHIHAGVSCEDVDGPQGHGWNSKVTGDMWTPAGGAVYNSNINGDASGKFPMYTGFGKYETMDHAVVIHAQDKTRIACGTLSW